MIRLLAIILCFLPPVVAHADEITDLKIELAIAEARALRLESLLQSPAASDDASDVAPSPAQDVAPPLVDIPRIVTPPPRAPRQRYVTRTVTKYRSETRQQCQFDRFGRKIGCKMVTVQVPYTVQERVLVRQEPTNIGQISNSADTYATPLDAATRILDYLRPTSPKTLLDLGSGDGRMVVEWARWTGHPAIGIEQDPYRVKQSRNFAKLKGVEQQAKFVQGDYTQMDWPRADIVYVYQFPDDLAAVRDKLTQYDHVVSYMHEIPGLQMTSHNGGEFYSWRKPRPVQQAVSAKPSRPVAWYGGKPFYAPVCNKRGCSMCANIRSQLAAQEAY